MKLIENASLQSMNTLAINAKARYLIRLETTADIAEAMAWNQTKQLPYLVVGEGSNLVLSRDWDGVVLHVALPGISVVSETADHVRIAIAGGESWHGCVERTVNSGWFGLENLALIPGTAGAAPVQNIGAYGKEISELLVSLEAISLLDGRVQRFDREQCGFQYRDSIFRGHCPNQWLITRIELQLTKTPRSVVTYPALVEHLQSTGIAPADAHPEQVMQAVMAIRRSKLPDPAVIPNAGSFFKNPIVDANTYTALKARYPALVAYPAAERWKLAAGWLIEQAGYKGVLRDGVGTAATQALVLVNPGHCGGDKVIAMAHEIQRAVHVAFGITLDIEPLVVD